MAALLRSFGKLIFQKKEGQQALLMKGGPQESHLFFKGYLGELFDFSSKHRNANAQKSVPFTVFAGPGFKKSCGVNCEVGIPQIGKCGMDFLSGHPDRSIGQLSPPWLLRQDRPPQTLSKSIPPKSTSGLVIQRYAKRNKGPARKAAFPF